MKKELLLPNPGCSHGGGVKCTGIKADMGWGGYSTVNEVVPRYNAVYLYPHLQIFFVQSGFLGSAS